MLSKAFFYRVVKSWGCVVRSKMTSFQTFSTQSCLLMTLMNEAFKNILEKGENAGNQHFLLFPEYFVPFPKPIFPFPKIFFFQFPKQILIFQPDLFCCLQSALNLDQSKIESFGNGLKNFIP